MHYKFASFIIVAGLAITAVLVSGCATGTISTGKISNSEDVFINAAYTFEDGETTSELIVKKNRNCFIFSFSLRNGLPFLLCGL